MSALTSVREMLTYATMTVDLLPLYCFLLPLMAVSGSITRM